LANWLKPFDFPHQKRYSTVMRKNQKPVTPAEIVAKLLPFVGKTFLEVSELTGVPFPAAGKAKGVVGWFVEALVGLTRDNDRLDYEWGDLKTKVYHAGKEIGGCVIGSLNSLANELLEDDVAFDDFILGKKIGQTVLVTVCTNRKGGGTAADGWENFTFEGVSTHALRDLPEWQGVCEDWEWLKNHIAKCAIEGVYVSSSQRGPNDFLRLNSCGGSFKFCGRNLRRNGGLQLALGKTVVQKLCR
jgi:hypothetical protein